MVLNCLKPELSRHLILDLYHALCMHTTCFHTSAITFWVRALLHPTTAKEMEHNIHIICGGRWNCVIYGVHGTAR